MHCTEHLLLSRDAAILFCVYHRYKLASSVRGLKRTAVGGWRRNSSKSNSTRACILRCNTRYVPQARRTWIIHKKKPAKSIPLPLAFARYSLATQAIPLQLQIVAACCDPVQQVNKFGRNLRISERHVSGNCNNAGLVCTTIDLYTGGI